MTFSFTVSLRFVQQNASSSGGISSGIKTDPKDSAVPGLPVTRTSLQVSFAGYPRNTDFCPHACQGKEPESLKILVAFIWGLSVRTISLRAELQEALKQFSDLEKMGVACTSRGVNEKVLMMHLKCRLGYMRFNDEQFYIKWKKRIETQS